MLCHIRSNGPMGWFLLREKWLPAPRNKQLCLQTESFGFVFNLTFQAVKMLTSTPPMLLHLDGTCRFLWPQDTLSFLLHF